MPFTLSLTKRSRYLVLLLGSSFYLYEFFLRVSPSVLTQQFMQYFSVGAGKLSIMSAAFFYAYMPMQIIAGLLGDRFGPRLLLTFAAGFCGLATCLFVSSDHLAIAGMSRFLMGLTASCAYIGPLMLASHWFDKRYFPMISGFIQLLGSLGAMLAGQPLVILLSHYSWQSVLLFAGLFGMLLSVIIYLFVRDEPSDQHTIVPIKNIGLKMEWQRLCQVGNKKATWFIALTGFAFWAPMSVFAELWGPSFLEQSEGINLLLASSQTKWLWFGVALGGPTLGYISHKMNSCRQPMILAFSSGLASMLWIVYAPHHSPLLLMIGMFVFGFSCAGQCLTFGLVRKLNTLDVVGTAVGFNNMAVIFGGTLLQPMTGWILEMFWQGQWKDHVHIFSVLTYRYAFAMLPLILLIGLLVTLFCIKEDN